MCNGNRPQGHRSVDESRDDCKRCNTLGQMCKELSSGLAYFFCTPMTSLTTSLQPYVSSRMIAFFIARLTLTLISNFYNRTSTLSYIGANLGRRSLMLKNAP
ncbi:hypothetical protein DPMN_035220 [Dreissena polymorpha]|uniref:Uncharacterized protein n=1 Tax=Dreissena polymorpha TaxID=45954 RepID=A0A9D4MAI2_DREPO|nr:hypothetical protein DPMN_035220 [Dreissena polymorpha]